VPVVTADSENDSITIPETSRLKNAELVVESNGSKDILFWDLPILPLVVPDPTDRIINTPNAVRLDQVSSDNYDTPHYWDLIAQANFFSLIPGDAKPGTKIRLPSLTRITTTLRP